ncbi:MAG: FHA domain-containing protein [Kofleriaceae bacterium]
MRVVIDHVAGVRRGQRQELDASSRIRFGRHPDCEVSFDPYRDIDASSRHAELRALDAGHWVLVDLGSSNGTYVDGHRVTEAAVSANVALDLVFGPGGPRVRLFIGDDAAIASLQPPILERTRPPWLLPAVIGTAFVVLIALLVGHC